MANPVTPVRRKPRFRERKAAEHAVKAPTPPRTTPTPPPARRPAARPHVRLGAVAVPRVTLEHVAYLSIVLIAFALRIWDDGSRAMHGDEAEHAWFAWNLFSGIGYAYDPVYHGPFQFPATALLYFLFGVSDLTGRLLAVLFGSALVALPYFLRREMGRVEALLASVFIALSPAFLYVSRLERDDIFTSFFAITTVIGIFGYVRSRRVRYVYLAVASLALSLSAMENTYITAFVFGTFLALVLGSEYLATTSLGRRASDFWGRSGSQHVVRARLPVAALVVLLLALALTVATGWFPPVPLVLAVIIIGLVHRQALMETAGQRQYITALRNISGQSWLNAATIALAILFLLYSTFGTNIRGIWDAASPFLNPGTACGGQSYSFPFNPCRRDILGGLFYWLSQHEVARGGQPWFYYPLLYGLYEQVAVFFGVGGVIWTLFRPTLFRAFLAYWAILMFGVYSWAGEKFPWLMIHPLTPFLLLGAMFIVHLFRLGAWPRLIALVSLAVLGVIQLHNAYEVNYVNGADPVEMMVYVQSAPDTPTVANKILALSQKATGGNDLHVTIDADDTWPFAWYLRDMPNIGYPAYPQIKQKPYTTNPVIIVDESHQPALQSQLKGYTGQRYRLRWWFPEDYKALTWSSFLRDLVDPGTWSSITRWEALRRPFGPKDGLWFYYYVKNGIASPY